jgi:hypothetical protein
MSDPNPPEVPREKLELSPAQIIGSAAAAVAAAIVCSFFGVGGTVIGTAIASVVATTGSALYAHSVRATARRLQYLQRTRVGLGGPPRPVADPAQLAEVAAVRRLPGQLPWPAVAVAALVVFVFSIGLVTTIEAALGKPLSSLVGGHAGTHRKTSLGGVLHSGPARPKTTPTPTPSATTSPTATPAATASPSPTPTTTGSGSPSPTGPPPPSPSPLLSLIR